MNLSRRDQPVDGRPMIDRNADLFFLLFPILSFFLFPSLIPPASHDSCLQIDPSKARVDSDQNRANMLRVLADGPGRTEQNRTFLCQNQSGPDSCFRSDSRPASDGWKAGYVSTSSCQLSRLQTITSHNSRFRPPVLAHCPYDIFCKYATRILTFFNARRAYNDVFYTRPNA